MLSGSTIAIRPPGLRKSRQRSRIPAPVALMSEETLPRTRQLKLVKNLGIIYRETGSERRIGKNHIKCSGLYRFSRFIRPGTKWLKTVGVKDIRRTIPMHGEVHLCCPY